jgi:hypothetical protein
MNPLAITAAIDGLLGLVGQWIPDKDKQAEIRAHIVDVQARVTEALATLTGKLAEFESMKLAAELQAKTIPWVDALHKMGRLINGWALLVVVGAAHAMGKPLDADTVMWVAGVMGVYNYVKGQGR